jgi:hypothetical protein
MTENINRQPKGIPVGGQFAATAHSEAPVSLSAPLPANPFSDADGTTWEMGGDDPHTDIYTSYVDGIEARVTTDIREEGARMEVIDHRGQRPLKLKDQTHFESLDEAKEAAKAIRGGNLKYGPNTIAVGAHSRWGTVQKVQPMAAGIDAIYTSGHGGLKLSPERAKEVDARWREDRGLYEEDCAWSKAAITHHRDLPEDYVQVAHKVAKEWYPDQYTEIVGQDPGKYGLTEFQPLTAADSRIIEQREFLSARAGTHDHIQSAMRELDSHPGMVAVTICDIPADGREVEGRSVTNSRTILVPEEEYNVPWTERHTFPKNDKYQVLETVPVQ